MCSDATTLCCGLNRVTFSSPYYTQQPSDHPNAGDAHYECYEILNHKVDNKKQWWLEAKFEDNDGKYASYQLWSEVANVFEDCKVSDDDPAEGNLVVVYANQLNKCPRGLFKAIAGAAKRGLENLFPQAAVAKPKAPSCCATVAPSPTISEKCQQKHLESKDFSQLLTSDERKFYFKKGEKYNGKKCQDCQQELVGTVSSRTPCYVCTDLHLDKTEKCDFLYCFACYGKKLAGSSSSGDRRRSRR